MAVIVIDDKPHQSVVKHKVCGKCGCTLQYVPNDVQEDYDTDYTGSRDIYHYIRCPKCGSQVRVSRY